MPRTCELQVRVPARFPSGILGEQKSEPLSVPANCQKNPELENLTGSLLVENAPCAVVLLQRDIFVLYFCTGFWFACLRHFTVLKPGAVVFVISGGSLCFGMSQMCIYV